jgi:hypothetical protein
MGGYFVPRGCPCGGERDACCDPGIDPSQGSFTNTSSSRITVAISTDDQRSTVSDYIDDTRLSGEGYALKK